MQNIKYKILDINDNTTMNTIANWYYQEWNISPAKTIDLLKEILLDTTQFQLVLEINGEPVATGGLYKKVGITAVDPSLKVFKHWLALVYTTPNHRKKGYASLLCTHIEKIASIKKIKKLHLFTHTAEALYTSLNWTPLKRIKLDDKNIVVMEKQLIFS